MLKELEDNEEINADEGSNTIFFPKVLQREKINVFIDYVWITKIFFCIIFSVSGFKVKIESSLTISNLLQNCNEKKKYQLGHSWGAREHKKPSTLLKVRLSVRSHDQAFLSQSFFPSPKNGRNVPDRQVFQWLLPKIIWASLDIL